MPSLKVPLFTLTIISINCLVHGLVFIAEPILSNFTINARNVIYLKEYYRIVTSAFIHANLMHLGFNMMSTLAIAGNLESELGTLWMAFTTLWSVFLCGAFYVAIQWLAFALEIGGSFEEHLYTQAVGFSGVIFCFAVMESFKSAQPNRSVFGLFLVPTKIYPWVLLVVLQFIMPGISFEGHLGGALLGLLHSFDIFSFLIPSLQMIKVIEDWKMIKFLSLRFDSFVVCPSEQHHEATVSYLKSFVNLFKGLWAALKYLGMIVFWVVTATLHILGCYISRDTVEYDRVAQNDVELAGMP